VPPARASVATNDAAIPEYPKNLSMIVSVGWAKAFNQSLFSIEIKIDERGRFAELRVTNPDKLPDQSAPAMGRTL
jgi:hypothetical protein